jgi:predicted Zn-dependent protease with MMP-like domain
MTNEEFEKLASEGIDLIDERFLKKLKNVEIVIEDDPTTFQMKKVHMKGGFLFGLYEGVPQTKREGYGQVLPDKITIFKNPIERFFQNPEDIRRAVADTIWHEIAHHFGMDEHQVRHAESERQNKKSDQ